MRQTQHEVEVNSIAIETATVVIEERHNKENKAESSITTKEDYVATIKIAE